MCVSLWAAFADVQKKVEKATKTHAKASNAEGVSAINRVWIKAVIMLEEDCETSWGKKKSFHKDNQRALTKVRQMIKKMVAGDLKVAAQHGLT